MSVSYDSYNLLLNKKYMVLMTFWSNSPDLNAIYKVGVDVSVVQIS